VHVVAFAAAEKYPIGQGGQKAEPEAAVKVPGAQGKQPVAPADPGL